MKERPILFSTDMVKAILEGRKTQTRRVVKPQPHKSCVGYGASMSPLHWIEKLPVDMTALYPNSKPTTINGDSIKCPYGQVGDRLWVRETWLESPNITDKLLREGADTWAECYYVAAETPQQIEQLKEWGWKVKPSIFMPRWASRITLEITDIRVQRVQDISQQDAIAEGVIFMGGMADNWDEAPWCASLKNQEPMKYPSAAYGRLWDSINAKRGYGWDKNPWVWAISFKRVNK